MQVNTKRLALFSISFLLTFIILRLSLYISPGTNLDILGYNIHHLYTGLVLIVIAAIPLIIFKADNNFLNCATVLFGVGLSLALDEWVYLITTDGSDSSYWLPISVWGGIIAILMTLVYTFLTVFFLRGGKTDNER